MKKIAIDLSVCSKEDRKEVIKLAKNAEFTWFDNDRFKTADWKYLILELSPKDLYYQDTIGDGGESFSMPQDLNKLKEALGIEVLAKSVEVPKDGDVLVVLSTDNLWITRTDSNRSKVYSVLMPQDNYFNDKGVWNNDRTFRKATPEEESKLIEAEHSNGWHWDGKELVKAPEYVNANSWGIVKLDFSTYNIDDDNFKTLKSSERITSYYAINNPSTREAYETQNMARLMNEKAKKTLDKIGEDFTNKAREYKPLSFYGHWMCPCVTIPYKTNKEFEKQMEALSRVISNEKKPTKRIILNQYKVIEILVDDFEMVHEDGKILLTPNGDSIVSTFKDGTISAQKHTIEMLEFCNDAQEKELNRLSDVNKKLSERIQSARSAGFEISNI